MYDCMLCLRCTATFVATCALLVVADGLCSPLLSLSKHRCAENNDLSENFRLVFVAPSYTCLKIASRQKKNAFSRKYCRRRPKQLLPIGVQLTKRWPAISRRCITLIISNESMRTQLSELSRPLHQSKWPRADQWSFFQIWITCFFGCFHPKNIYFNNTNILYSGWHELNFG